MKAFIAARKSKKRWHWLLVLALAVLIATYAYWNMDKHNTGLSSETESSPEDTTGVFHDNEEKSNILSKTATVTNGDDKTAGYDLTPVTPKPESHQTENNDSPTTAPSSPAGQLLEFEKLKSMTDFRLRIQIKGEPAREASPELAEKIAGILKEYKDVLHHLPPYSREILPSDGHYEAVLSFEGLADIHIMPYGLFCFTNVPEIFFDDHMYDHYLMECLKYIEQKENVYYLSKGDPQLLEYEEDEPQKSIQADLNGDGRYEKLEVYYNGDLSLWINDKKYLFEHDKELFRVNLVEREIENWDMVLDISIRPENDGSLIVLSYTHIGADNSHTEFYTMKYSRDDTLMSYSFEPVRNIQSTYENNTVTLILDDYGIKEEISFTEKHYEDAVEYSDMEGISVREYLTGEALFYFSEPYGYFIQDVNIDGVHELNVICDLKREFKFYITVLELTYGLKDGKWQLIDINKHEHTSTPTESSSLSSSEPLSSPVTRVEPGRKFELQTADSDALQARYPLIDLSAVDQQGTYALISSNIRYPDDVNGDKSRDIVLLLSEDHTAVKNPFLLVQDGTTLEYNKIFLDKMSFFSGSNEIHLRTYIDADGDGKNDIIIEAGKNQSSTDGRSLCIFGFPGNIPVTILNWVNPGIQYVVQYAEGYGLQITSEENGLNAVADIEEPAKIAPDKYPFDSQGRPDDLTSPWQAGPIAQYKLVDYDGDGIIEFEIGQYVYNHHGTELLGTAWCLIKKDPQTGGWKPTDTTFTSSCPVMMKNENIIKRYMNDQMQMLMEMGKMKK